MWFTLNMYGQTATNSSMQVFKLLMNLVDTFQPNILVWLIWEWFQVFWMEIWFNSWYCQRVLIAFHTCSSSLPRPRATPPQARCLASPPPQWRWPLHWTTELWHQLILKRLSRGQVTARIWSLRECNLLGLTSSPWSAWNLSFHNDMYFWCPSSTWNKWS